MPHQTDSVITQGRLPLPEAVRKHLGLADGDSVEFVIAPDGTVTLHVPGRDLEALYGCLPRPAERVSVAEMEQSLEEALAAEDERIRHGQG